MTMASISKPSPFLHRHSNPTSLFLSPVILSFPSCRATSLHLRVSALRSDGDKIGSQESFGSNVLRKPVFSPSGGDLDGNSEKEEGSDGESEEEGGWIDWEDKILEDTVPLVGFVRMILHSGKYESGARLNPEHERTILERLLPYHPEFEKKIGCGIDYITIGYHPDFEGSRCLFIVRKDGELVDFSYWKCIKGLIRKNYPLYADSFILRHFRRHKWSGRRREKFDLLVLIDEARIHQYTASNISMIFRGSLIIRRGPDLPWLYIRLSSSEGQEDDDD